MSARVMVVILMVTVAGAALGGCTQLPRAYDAPRAVAPIAIDGDLTDAAWQAASWSVPFEDIRGGDAPRPLYETRMKMCWDDEHLYVAAELEEPHVWGTLTTRDAIIYNDNDFEIFIDPDGDTLQYYELEVNVLNTMMDLFMDRPYNEGGNFDLKWDCVGLQHAVGVNGTVNDPRDVDRGWTVECAIPWTALAEFTHVASPPRRGDTWRINFSRVEWRFTVVDGAYVRNKKKSGDPSTHEDNWVWSPQGVINMHVPERWGFVTFR